ncbi:MAG: ABC transporter substrate-binding protein [Devosia sp.]
MRTTALLWGAALFAGAATLMAAPASAQDAAATPDAACAAPTQVIEGFTTCADVAAAKAEGTLVLYSSEVETGTVQMIDEFKKLFPEISPQYVRLQIGPLYSRLLAETQAGVHAADLINLNEPALAIDLQGRNGYKIYISPELKNYEEGFWSNPPGNFTETAYVTCGIAYNPNVVDPATAPKNWPDLLDPKWADSIMVKMSTTFTQRSFFNEMRKLYGDEFWAKFGELHPVAYDSMVQQNDRLVNEQDKIAACAQDSGYLDFKRRGAPIAFVVPTDGLVGAPVSWGIVADAPHPEAAKLYYDFLLSAYGQAKNVQALLKVPTRTDVPGPEGVVTADSKILYSPDLARSLENRAEYQKEWDAMVGMP